MHVGICQLTFRLPGNGSLKDKRQVSRSLISRLQTRFHLAAAEVGGIDQHQSLVIGLACVSNQARHADEMLDAAVRFAQNHHIDADLINVQREIIDGE
ncbi:MAG: DUF503 domain-containing protein [Dehalococcoidia bacterium]